MKQLFPLLFLALAICSNAFGQAPVAVGTDSSPIAEAYLAKPDTDGTAGEPATEFVTSDVPIFCVVRLAANEIATVKMNLVAVNVPGVRPETKVIGTTYTTKEGETIVNFTGRPHGKWVAGKYRADIYVEGKLSTSLTFDVKGSAKPAAASSFAPAEPAPQKPRKRKRN